jgi:phosphoribosylanthranilate isomerase
MVAGVARLEDAVEMAHLGVDALGFRLDGKGPRRVEPSMLRALSDRLPPWLTRVGLVRAGAPVRLLREAGEAGLHLLELEEPPSPASLRGLPLPAYPSLPLTPDLDPLELRTWGPGWVLLRAAAEQGPAGRLPACWSRAEEGSRYARILLGGPMGSGELELALRRVRPGGLVLGRGVEREPGVLDVARVEAALELVDRLEG